MIPVSRPSVGEQELQRVKNVFESGWLGMGSQVFEFENVLKSFLDAENVIAVNTGTSALHIAMDSLNLKNSDEVLVPSFTFTASIQAIIACGAKPVFVDIEKDTLNMDIKDLKKKAGPKTKVIMPVHYGGQPCDMDSILDIASLCKAAVVEDAAHAFGSNYKGRKIGSFGDITCFSFDPIKNITCGEGGAVVLKDSTLAAEIIKKRILGIDKDTWHRYKNERSWFYEVTSTGFRYHMSNINAAIGLVQMSKFSDLAQKRKDIAKRYDEAFSRISGIELLKRDYEAIVPFNYVVKVCSDRDKLMDYLKEHGVDSGIHYIPNHIQPAFRKYHLDLPVTDDIFKKILSLPLYPGMAESDMDKVIDVLRGYFKVG